MSDTHPSQSRQRPTVFIGALLIALPALAVTTPAEPVWFPPADITVAQDALDSAPPFEQRMLRDGTVSYSEYLGSLEALATCLRRSGYEVTPLIEGPEEGFLHFNADPPPDEVPAFVGYFECESQYASVVPAVYFIQKVPTGPELAKRIRALADCLSVSEIPADLTHTARGLRQAFVEPDELSDVAISCFARFETVLHAIDTGEDDQARQGL